MSDENEAKQPIRDIVKKELTPLIRKKFENFSADLIKGNARELMEEKGEYSITV